MPVLTKGDSNMIVMPASYSPATVARSFKVIHEFELAGRPLQVIYDEGTPRAAIINGKTENINGTERHRVIASLDLTRRQTIGDDVIAVERFWQDPEIMQVEGVCVEPGARDKGLATLLYETLINQCGLILMSDNEQYDGGKMLWQKIARESSEIVVFVLDTDRGAFWPYDGSKIIYDGGSIPEEKIWSTHPDKTHWGVVLVAESKQRACRLMR